MINKRHCKKIILLSLIIIISSCWSPQDLLYGNFIKILANCDTSDEIAGHMARIEWLVEKKYNRIRYYAEKSFDGKLIGDYYEFYSGTTSKFYYCFSSDAPNRYDKFMEFVSENSVKEESRKMRNDADGKVYKINNECFICDKGFIEKNNGFVIVVSKTPNFNMPEIHIPQPPSKVPPVIRLPGGGIIRRNN